MNNYSWWKELFENENNKYGKNDFALGMSFFLLECCIYSAKITEDLPNPDAIWNGVFYKAGYQWETSLGRYMIGLLQTFRSYIVNTSFITLVCLMFLSFICIYVLKIFEIKTLGWKLIVGALIVISPTVGSTLTYYYCSDLYMLSYFLAVLSVWFMIGKGGKSRVLVSSIFLMLSAAIYQAYISLAILLCLIYLMKLLVDADISNKEICRKAINSLLGGSIGVGLYLVSNKLVQRVSRIEATEGRGFSKMGIISLKNIHEQIKHCYVDFWRYYFSDSMINNNCYGRKYINMIFFLILAVIVLGVLLKQRITIGRKVVFAIMCSLFPLISMNICILAPEVSILDTTGVLMLPTMNYTYVLAIVMMQLLNVRESCHRACGIGIFVGTLAVLYMLLYLELGGQSYMQHNMLKTYNVAMQIEKRVEQYTENGRICIIGNMEDGNYPECYPELAESQHWVTASYKTIWTDFNGCQNCWLRFMEQYLGKTYSMCSLAEYYDIISTPEYQSMEMFPDANSVVVINNIAVIKLSDAVW